MILIHPMSDAPEADARLQGVLDEVFMGTAVRTICRMEYLPDLRGQKLLFAVSLGRVGINLEYIQLLYYLRSHPDALEGCIAGIVIDASNQQYTKSTATELVLAANQAGCAFVGRPLVEATESLSNFAIQAQQGNTDLMGAYRSAVKELVSRLERDAVHESRELANLLILHAANHSKSNTMSLWNLVKSHLGDTVTCTEIGLRNGTVADCSGCPYTMCLHFGEQGKCFYGGVIQDTVYPALRRCDGVVMLCPNYNDAVSANMTAFINRLTAIFRQTRFYDKALFALVVSGYSGNDIVARQLISAMNMNKSFYLPPRFAMLETANQPLEILQAQGIASRAETFAQQILDVMCKRLEE